MENYNEKLNWRYATKKFNPEKSLSEEQVEYLQKSIQLSASSYGLQPYEVFVVTDKETKEKLKEAAWNQSQLTDASHVFIFAGLKKLNENYIDSYLENISKIREIKVQDLSGLKDMLTSNIVDKPEEQQKIWAQKQAYIALGNLLSAAAHLKVDTCPMEGFDAGKVDEVLGISGTNLTTAVIATAGYRSDEDQMQHAKKVRKQENELFHLI
ncbi:NAD(P)H-dependent oxidoreductase [Salegentibacter maritimus]|uniref:NAD(P)H-dependent oxidoreductase n=1 Tax=Salegentibacter maritimus TaxID=2794347 RepID=A0ABS0TFW0_9FLAO|nr:NAD(P)H-dependent oxidoreductase [Salegentibacter maritimus]MBI6119944.1 NAD(P)H-dependent oxidoreductase [Salegentibacter maritimus]